MNFRKTISALSYLIVFVISLVTSNYHKELIYALVCISLLSLLDKLGRGIVLRESIALLYILTCLVMPMMGYEVYNYDNVLARLWKNYMQVPRETYYSFAMPAVSVFCLALTFPFFNKKFDDEGPFLLNVLNKCKQVLQNDRLVGIIIMVVGLLSFVIIKLLPSAFQYVATILFFCSFSGLLYIYFLPEFKSKLIVLLIFLAFLILNAISIGMFTIVAYMSITIFSFFFIGRKTWLFKKVLILLAAVFIIIVLQNTKVTYRSYVWNKNYGGDNTLLFTTLFIDNLKKGDLLIEKRAFFPIYTRTNQGFYISLVMKRIPSLQPFDNGKVLTNTILSSLVPRFLWPDKPEAGGKFNMNFYAGRKLRGYSANVGPMGEAYGSFGIKGGIIFMFMLGLFIRWTYGRLLALTSRIPLIIFWLPVLYFQVTYSAETDTLQILNSLFKTAFFMWILYKVFPRWYGVNRQTTSVKSDKKVLSNQFV